MEEKKLEICKQQELMKVILGRIKSLVKAKASQSQVSIW